MERTKSTIELYENGCVARLVIRFVAPTHISVLLLESVKQKEEDEN